MNKTNTGLVNYAKAQLGKPYWYGTFGNTACEALYNEKKKQYPSYYKAGKYNTGWTQQYGQRVHDCIGLIKGYIWSDTTDGKPVYNAKQDVSANGMYSVCRERGVISTLPEIPGILLFMNGHVGVYEGGGNVIEARGHDYGVVRTKLCDRQWTNWGKCPWIEYSAGLLTEDVGKKCFPKYTGKTNSIVDALKSVGAEHTFLYRAKIAKANNISGYIGTAKQNTQLLNLIKNGKLLKP